MTKKPAPESGIRVNPRQYPCNSASFSLRKAQESDASSIAQLMAELDYPSSTLEITERFRKLSTQSSNYVLVARTENEVIGLVALHIVPLMHLNPNLGRITALVISEKWRRSGVGKKLMEAVEQIAQNNNCSKMEITSGDQRTGAHDFYRRLGYEEVRRRFIKSL